jgi:hypothetical protein
MTVTEIFDLNVPPNQSHTEIDGQDCRRSGLKSNQRTPILGGWALFQFADGISMEMPSALVLGDL